MKEFWIFIITIIPLLGFTSCDDRDEIRDEIDALSARLDKLQPQLDKLNDNISTFYDLANGVILFTDYSYNSENGNYTIKLSNGKSWTVYSGKPEHGEPVVTIKDGNWVMEYNGETKVLGPALPEDGKNGVTPKMYIDENGYWCYTINGENHQVPGPYNVADITKIEPSIFQEVVAEGNTLKFKLYGQEDYTEVYALGGLDMTFSNGTTEDVTAVDVNKDSSVTLTAKLTSVDKVVINPTPLNVVLSKGDTDNLIITAPATITEDTYKVYFEIYSKEGYRLVKTLDVTVTASTATTTSNN